MDIIIDNESTDNLVSTKAVSALKLPTVKHDRPYKLGWIKTGEASSDYLIFLHIDIRIGDITEAC